MAELDFSEGALPLYSQVAYGLCRRIKDGEFTVGSFLPSQSDLSSYYGVSRITIINAIRFLTEKGILRSHQGKGSLVLKSEIGVDSYVEEGFSMQVQKHGFSASTKVVSAKIVKASGDVLSSLISSSLVDYVAMDVKNSLSRYPETAGVPHLFPSLIEESISYLMEGHVPYEFRTTVVHELHSDEDFESIGKMCAGCSNYFLQSYSDRGDIINPIFSSPTAEEMERYIKILRKTIENVSFRDR